MNVHSGYPASGDMIGDYQVGRRLGVGGMGVVFEALDTVLNRQVALKVIAAPLLENPDFAGRFAREARAQASLDSPHVVQVYAYGEADGRLYLATQLIPDGDLGAMLEANGAPPPRIAVELIAQVAAGLADAHATGLIHRDIKPANVLLRRRETSVVAYLADFGIARHVDARQTRLTAGTIGTPTYMAPELHLGTPSGVTSDVYSLGCLLWATLTGEAPYGGSSEYQIVLNHREQPVPQLDDASPFAVAVNSVLQRALAKPPEDRYPDAAAMRDALRAAAALPHTPPLVTPVPASTATATATATPTPKLTPAPAPAPAAAPAKAQGRGRVVAVVVGTLLLVAGAVGVGVWALTRDDDTAPADASSASPSTTDPSADSTLTVPSASSATLEPGSGDEATAAASLAQALAAEGVLDAEQSQCTAEAWIEAAGLQTMIDAGLFDEDLNYVDVDQSALTPELREAALAAVTGCATSAS